MEQAGPKITGSSLCLLCAGIRGVLCLGQHLRLDRLLTRLASIIEPRTDNLAFPILLPPTPQCWGFRGPASPHLISEMLGIKSPGFMHAAGAFCQLSHMPGLQWYFSKCQAEQLNLALTPVISSPCPAYFLGAEPSDPITPLGGSDSPEVSVPNLQCLLGTIGQTRWLSDASAWCGGPLCQL